MVNPPRDTTAGRVYNDLRNLARRTGRSTDEVMVEYVLERFLYRISVSPHGQAHFVLKGGLLLARFGARRATRDIDVLGRAFPNDEAESVRRIAAIAATEVDDGTVFDPVTVRTVPIREEDEYHGLRLTMAATIARARLKVQLDISFGDPVTPAPTTIDYPQHLTHETFPILGYPLATVIAEKLTTAISLGELNTRDRDYADLYRLLGLNELDGAELAAAPAVTAAHRHITLEPLGGVLADLADRRQNSYAAWRRRQGSAAGAYPERFVEVVRQVIAFADPLLTGAVASSRWIPATRSWG